MRTLAGFLRRCGNLSRRRFLRGLVRSTLAALPLASYGPSRSGASAELHLRVYERGKGRPLPARFHLELEDGRHWTPTRRPLGHGHGTSLSDVLTGEDFHPMLAPARCALLWTHLSRGEAVLELPAGRHRLYLSRGFEYRPLDLEITLSPGKKRTVEAALERWIDMPAQGFYSGDIHQHFSRRSPEDNHLWQALAEAEDLHVSNTMVLKHGEPEHRYPQYAYGRPGTHQQGHYVIVPGEEFRDNDLGGHVTLAGIQQVVEPVSTGPRLGLRENFPPFSVACRQAREQGAVVGWAHGGVSGDWGGARGMESVAVEAALGLIDVLEVVQFMSFLGETFWYRLLGSGLRLPGVGGTDFPFGIWLAPWYPSFGQERTFVRVKGLFARKAGLRESAAGNCSPPTVLCFGFRWKRRPRGALCTSRPASGPGCRRRLVVSIPWRGWRSCATGKWSRL